MAPVSARTATALPAAGAAPSEKSPSGRRLQRSSPPAPDRSPNAKGIADLSGHAGRGSRPEPPTESAPHPNRSPPPSLHQPIATALPFESDSLEKSTEI